MSEFGGQHGMRRSLHLAGLPFLIAYCAYAQTAVNERLAAGTGCSGINFEQQQYTIGAVSLQGPFDFPWYLTRAGSTKARLQNQLHGKRFTYQLVVTDTLHSLKGSGESAAFGVFRASVAMVVATACDRSAHTVDLAYRVYSIPPPNMLSGTPESQQQARKAPQDATGLTSGGSPLHFTPEASFNGWKQISSGGRLAFERKDFSLTAEGSGSAAAYQAQAAAAGSHDLPGRLSRLDWRLNAASSSQPTVGGSLAQTQFTGQLSAATRSFAGGNLMGRFGGLLEGGNLHSDLQPQEIAPSSIANGAYLSGKFYGGISSRTAHNVFSISTGIELGSVQSSSGGYWRKVLGDVVDEFWIPVKDHHALEVETRLTAGRIPSFRSIPVAERFFGGSADASFIPGDSWQIRSEPVIRAIPANRLFQTARGAGAESFVSLNATLAYPVWAKPMVPPVVKAEVVPLLDGQLTTATSLLQNSYASKDPGFQDILKSLSQLDPALAGLKTAVAAGKKANPGKFETQFDDCSDAILAANFFLTKLKDAKDKYALATSMPSTLADVWKACAVALNKQLNDPAIQNASMGVDDIAKQIDAKNQALQSAAAAKAGNDMAFVRRIIKTLVSDMNVVSIAPVAVADWARIGPAGNEGKGSRFGPGGGFRIELASYVNLTLGYAFNMGHQPGEGRGALFFSIGVRDLLH